MVLTVHLVDQCLLAGKPHARKFPNCLLEPLFARQIGGGRQFVLIETDSRSMMKLHLLAHAYLKQGENAAKIHQLVSRLSE